jgi:toxin CcdB
MKQFDVFRNPDSHSARQRPYLVILQSDVLRGVATAVVAPLALSSRFPPISRLTPTVTIAGKEYVILISDLASIPRKVLKRSIGTTATKRDEILAALDLVFVGF